MRLADFDYALPPGLIAQRPASPRDTSRLLVLDRATGRVTHRVFNEIGAYLRAGDVLALNDTRVLPARLRGRRPGSGGAVEVLLLRPTDGGAWEALVRPGRRVPPGTMVEVGGDGTVIEIGDRLDGGRRAVRVPSGESMMDVMRRGGEAPVPPYIKHPLDDPEDYQTVYARVDGAVAAPTAGLHFTPALLNQLRAQGIAIVTLTLHVGPGTFQPVVAEDITTHRIDGEYYTIPAEAAEALNGRRGRLIAVGTTVVRALETVALPDGRMRPGSGWTDLLILPGFPFRAVQALVTNFHLPHTTLLMLVSAFAGRQTVLQAYAEAIRERYRFYSFGDAMLIL